MRIVHNFVVLCLASVLWLMPAVAAEGDNLIGIWALDTAKSKSESGPLPKSEVRTYGRINPEGTLTLVVEGLEANGMPYAYGATGDVNGREYPIPGRDEGARILGDRISWTSIDPYTVEMKVTKKGEVINTTRHSVSQDGKTLTVSENGIDPDGKPIHATRVYQRR